MSTHAIPRLVPGTHYEFLLVFVVHLPTETARFLNARIETQDGLLTTAHLMSGVRSTAHALSVSVSEDDVVILNAIGPVLVANEYTTGGANPQWN